MKRKTLIAAAVLLSVGGLVALMAAPPGANKSPSREIAFFMRAKLANAQRVLEGLVTEDLDLVSNGAERMLIMSKAAEWKIDGGPVYANDTAQFVAAAKDLVKHAKAKNLDGATLSYLQLTMSCVNCHKHVRAAKVAAGEAIPPGLQDERLVSVTEIARLVRAR